MANRIFRVGIKTDPNKPPVEHLVRATGKQQAADHVTAGMIVVEVADQEDVYRLAQAGVKLQDATAPAAPAKPDPKGSTK